MKKVFVFPSSFGKFSDEPERILREAGLEVTKFFKAGMTEDEVIEKLQGYDAVILGIEPMTARVMEACPATVWAWTMWTRRRRAVWVSARSIRPVQTPTRWRTIPLA